MNETAPIPEKEVVESHSAGGVVLNNEGQVLIVRQQGNTWSLPKGHLNEGEDKFAAAKREIFEESGISDLQLVRDLGDYSRPKMGLGGVEDPSEIKTISFFLFTTDEVELKPQDPDNPEALWLNKDEAVTRLTHPKDREFLARVLESI